MPLWLNLVLFQLTWVATVAGAGQNRWWVGPIALVVLAVVVFRLTPWPRSDFALLCLCCFLGLAIDTAYVQLGLLRFAEPVPFDDLAPIWILCMWMSFALTLNHSLRHFHGRPLIAALFGLLGGPFAYYVAASKFDAAEILGDVRLAYLAIGISWALVTPLLVALAGRWQLEFDHRVGNPPA